MSGDGTRTFVWDGADRLVQRGSDTFSYDPLGRLTRSEVRLSVPPKAEDAPRTLSETYAYDGDGLLRSRSVRGDDRRPHRHEDEDDDRQTTAFLWETSQAPAPLLAAGTDRVVQGLGPLYLVAQDGRTTTLVRDALGSVRAETNSRGAITKAFRYAAYGAVAQRLPASASPTLLGFAGELADPSGLIYLRARWYDPGTARFMTRDPFQGVAPTPTTLNGFGYSDGDPSLRIDPTGLATGGVCITASFSAGGYAAYQICPVVIDTTGNVGWSATMGAGLSPSLAVSATGGLQGSNAGRLTDLGGPFTNVGGSAGEYVVGGSDWFWSGDASVQGGSAQAGFGFRATGFAPVEAHAATTHTQTGIFFNVFDLFRRVLGIGNGKRPCGC